MPFPVPNPRITPGPNAFAKRASVQDGTHLNFQFAESARNSPSEHENSVNKSGVYSPSIYTPTRSVLNDANVSSGCDGLTGAAPAISSFRQTNLLPSRGSNKQLPPNPASKHVEDVDTTSLLGSIADSTPPMHQNNKEHNTQWLRPLEETNATWRVRRAQPPTRLNLHLARSDTLLSVSQRRAASLEKGRDTQGELQLDQTSKRRFLDRIGLPVRQNNASGIRRPSDEQLTAAPKERMPAKAARLLGTSAGTIPHNPLRLPAAKATEQMLPSFGELDLPEPTPPFTSDQLSPCIPSPCRRNYSPRMTRETSDHRLLLLNDRIASNMCDVSSEHTSANVENAFHYSAVQEAPSPPPKSPLRRELRKVDSRSIAPPLFENLASDEALDRQSKLDHSIHFHSGPIQQETQIIGGDARVPNMSSVYGSLHGSGSIDSHLDQSFRGQTTEENATLPSQIKADSTPAPTATSKSTLPTTHQELYPSPLHIAQPKSRADMKTVSHGTLNLLGHKASLSSAEDKVGRQKLLQSASEDLETETGSQPRSQEKRHNPSISSPPVIPHHSSTPRDRPTATPQRARNTSGPARAASGTPTTIPEHSILKNIEATLDTQKKELFELKGDISRNDDANSSRFMSVERKLGSVHREINSLATELSKLRENIVKTSVVCSSMPQSSTSSHSTEQRESLKQSKETQPPVSHSGSFIGGPDTAPALQATPTVFSQPNTSSHSAVSSTSSKHERSQPQGLTDEGRVLPTTAYVSPQNKTNKRRRDKPTTTSSAGRLPAMTGQGQETNISDTPARTTSTLTSPSNCSSVRNAVRNIERKASNTVVDRVATGDEGFCRPIRTPSSRMAACPQDTSPTRSIAARGLAAMKRAMSPVRGQAVTPVDPVRYEQDDELVRSAPAAQRMYKSSMEDLADFGVSNPVPTLYGKKEYATERKEAHRYWSAAERGSRQWRSTR